MTELRRWPIVVAVALLVVVPLAGCIGGPGSSSAPQAPGGGSGQGGGSGSDDGSGSDGSSGDGDGASTSGNRPHVHDRWEDQEARTLVDQTVTVEAITQDEPLLLRQCKFSNRNLCLGSATFAPEAQGGTGTIVPPGTANLEVTLDYDTADFAGLRLYWRDRIASGGCQPGWGCRAVASPTTFEINITDERQTDDGHASVSAWRFILDAYQVPGVDQPGQGAFVHYGEGEVDVEIVAHRIEGELPLEPPHPEFWTNTSTYRVGYLQGSTDQMGQAGFVYAEQNPPEDACPTSFRDACIPAGAGTGLVWDIEPGHEGRRTRYRGGENLSQLDPARAVALLPPKTGTIGVRATVEGQVTAETRLCVLGFHSPGQDDPVQIGCQNFQEGSWTQDWTYAVPETQVDSFYADSWGDNSSRWNFRVRLSAPDQGPTYGASAFSGSVTVAIFATEDTEFSMPEWGMDAPE